MEFLTLMSCEFVHLPGDNTATGNTIGIFFEMDGNGNCQNGESVYQSGDWVVIVSRGLLITSILCGFWTILMAVLSLIRCSFYCRSCLEYMSLFVAWTTSAITFVFYAAEACGVNTNPADIDEETFETKCRYNKASTYMIVASALYLVAIFLQCL